jgi:hypothetical protein
MMLEQLEACQIGVKKLLTRLSAVGSGQLAPKDLDIAV